MMNENRTPSDLNDHFIKEPYTLNPIDIQVVDNDIETGSNKIVNDKEYILKGILKKPNNEEDQAHTNLMIIKIFGIIALFLILTPIIVCDLYFGFSDHTCINEMPNGLNYTLKLYLLVSGFMELIWLLVGIYTICLLSITNDDITKFVYVNQFIKFGLIFNLIWNILGAVTFWGSIYKGGHCDSETSTYIYVSLIIKLIGNLITLQQNSNKKE